MKVGRARIINHVGHIDGHCGLCKPVGIGPMWDFDQDLLIWVCRDCVQHLLLAEQTLVMRHHLAQPSHEIITQNP